MKGAPGFNDRKYSVQKLHTSKLGKLNLNPKQYYTFFPHTPDNSFLGFAVPKVETNHTLKENISLLYGKDPTYFQEKEHFIHKIGAVFPVHATTGMGQLHGVVNHGVLTGLEYRKLMEKTKVMLGVGLPVESSGALEAIARGMAFIQPVLPVSQSDKIMEGKPTTRKLTSQVPYLERFMGPPYVYTIDENNDQQINTTLQAILHTKLRAFLPREFSMEGMLERLAVLFEKQNFCDPESPIWPPVSEMKVTVSKTGEDCIDTCHAQGLVCEPAYFPEINGDHFKRLNISCVETVRESDIYYPAVVLDTGICKLQSTPILHSCAGRQAGLVRVCPCRQYIKYQVGLCKTCLQP